MNEQKQAIINRAVTRGLNPDAPMKDSGIEWFGEVPDLAEQVDNPQLVQTAGFLAPILGIAGGAMARARALWGGILLLLSAGGLWYGFGFGVFTMFPIAFCAIGGLLALAAGRPDREVSHF